MNNKNKIIIIILLVLLLGILLVALDSPYLNIAQNIASGDVEKVLEPTNKIEKGNLSITVTGDVMFGRNMPGVLSLDSSPYRHVSNVTSDTDILLVNTENPFTTSGDAVKPDVPLKASPEYIPLLNATSGMVISANANNHVFDYGVTGMRDSIKNLDSNGIAHIGAGENKAEATKPITIEKEGHKITIFNYMDSENFQEYSQEVMPIAGDNSPGYSAWDDTESVEQIKQAKANGSDIIIVYMHYGNEYSRSPNENQIKISHLAIDAGASAVVGAHTHVTQGIEVYNGKPIFYNLGNFMFDQSNTATHSAYFVDFDVHGENITANVYPVYISGYLPQFMDSVDGKSLLSSLNPNCDQMTITDDGIGKIDFSVKNETK
ncbi:CapA family protein [Methanosphaera sp. ISO3-F5]|uniref:CapA family protein n=1 Tax=Methanosphaera sp. ISO3-F5 TaxID=1452353 RepID=UPI002B25A270|nr:CapA family protein [Methanosphaera sp. ISO3-F5]WQH64124.1 CapA family protein [Methanosphaera sp. ISO3-F5]